MRPEFFPIYSRKCDCTWISQHNLIQRVPLTRLEEYRSTELIKDPILPEDVADTLAFLISDQSKHYTGAIFDLNNGGYRR